MKTKNLSAEEGLRKLQLKNKFLRDKKFYTPKVRGYAKIGRNDKCPCNSGKKYKKCCITINHNPTTNN